MGRPGLTELLPHRELAGEGISPKVDNSSDELRECDSDEGEGRGSKILENIAGRRM